MLKKDLSVLHKQVLLLYEVLLFYMYMKKSIFALAIVFFLSFAGIGFAQNAGWIGTSWINIGSVIPASPLKSNLDWLQENKVHKPQDCITPGDRLVWKDADWGCENAPEPPEKVYRDCSFNGSTVLHGQSTVAFERESEPFGDRCNSEVRTCNDGTLSGSFPFGSCSVDGAASCTFTPTNGSQVVVQHGESVAAYQAGSVAYGSTCQSQARTCNNGTLSGSYQFSSCTVGGAASCTFDGNEIAHGGTVTAYETASVEEPDSCTSEVRTCNNGALSGTYVEPSCTVNPCTDCGRDPIRAGCYIDTQAWDVPSVGACFEDGGCTITDAISWSVGDFQRQTTHGLGDYEFRDPGLYTIQWTGACTGTGHSCTVYDMRNTVASPHTATVTVRDRSTGQVVFTDTVEARKRVRQCDDNTQEQ